MKKIISVLITLSMIISLANTFAFATETVNRNPYSAENPIKFSSADLYSWSDGGKNSFTTGADAVGSAYKGNWALFEDVNFANGDVTGFNLNMKLGSGAAPNSNISIYAVSKDGSYEVSDFDASSGTLTSNTATVQKLYYTMVSMNTDDNWTTVRAFAGTKQSGADITGLLKGNVDLVVVVEYNQNSKTAGDLAGFYFDGILPEPANRVPYTSENPIKFSTAELYSWSDGGKTAFTTGADAVGSAYKGNWALFEDVDFGKNQVTGFNLNMKLGSGAAPNSNISVYAVSKDGNYELSDFDASSGALTSSTATVTKLYYTNVSMKAEDNWTTVRPCQGTLQSGTDVAGILKGKVDIVVVVEYNQNNKTAGDIAGFYFDCIEFSEEPFERVDFVTADYHNATLNTGKYTDVDGTEKTSYMGGIDGTKYIAFENVDLGSKGINEINLALGHDKYVGNIYVWLFPANTVSSGEFSVSNGVISSPAGGNMVATVTTTTDVTPGWETAELHTVKLTDGESIKGAYDVVFTFNKNGLGNLFWFNFVAKDFTMGTALTEGKADVYIVPATYMALMLEYYDGTSEDETTVVIKNNDGEVIVNKTFTANGFSKNVVDLGIFSVMEAGNYSVEITAPEGSALPTGAALIRSAYVEDAEFFDFSNYYNIDYGVYYDGEKYTGVQQESIIEYIIDFGDETNLYTWNVDYTSNLTSGGFILYIDEQAVVTKEINEANPERVTESLPVPMGISGMHAVSIIFTISDVAEIYDMSFVQNDILTLYSEKAQAVETNILTKNYKDGTWILSASYDKTGKLLGVDKMNVVNTNGISRGVISAPMGNEGYYVKTFIWDGDDIIKPSEESKKYLPAYSLDDSINAYETIYPGSAYWTGNARFAVNSDNSIGNTSKDTEFRIGNVDFGDADNVESLDITYVTSFKNSQIKFYIDTVDEDYLIATFDCGTDVDSTWSKKLTKTVDVNRRIQGLHDVYVVYSNNACNIFDLKFN